jgi:hypothetical protein
MNTTLSAGQSNIEDICNVIKNQKEVVLWIGKTLESR